MTRGRRSGGFWRDYLRVAVFGSAVALLLLAAGLLLHLRSLVWAAAILGGLVALPFALILLTAVLALAFLAFFLMLSPFFKLFTWRAYRVAREALRKQLSALDALPAGEEARLAEVLGEIRRLSPKGNEAVLSRVRSPAYPWRLPLMEFVSLEVLGEIARQADDPLGPVAWKLVLQERFVDSRRLRQDIPPEEIQKLWRRALGTSDPFALPPELEIRSDPQPM